MTRRRAVGLLAEFETDIDRQFRARRGPNGEPSTDDVRRLEVPRSTELFAERFDELPELFAGRPEYRVAVTEGRLVSAVAVIGQLAADGAVELVSLEADP